MAKYKLEYIWLDGYTPMANLRSKTQIKEFASFPTLEQLPNWGFDGSSTQQAEGRSSDCVLKPVAVYPDSTRKNGVLVPAAGLLLAAAHAQVLAQSQPARDARQRRRADEPVLHAGEFALGHSRVRAEERVGDDEAEDGVADELQRLVTLISGPAHPR